MSQHLSPLYLSDVTSAVIGVSGGPDSLCLLDLSHQIPSLDITVAYFNHGLRPEADNEADFVRGLAEKMGHPFISERANVRSYAKGNSLSLEEAARVLRYRFLFGQARQRHASVVAVGHTADDQVETILMHFLRGAGLAGLKGMSGWVCPNEFEQEIPLVRPILHLWRAETAAYCRDHNLQAVEDASNRDETYFRNRLRHSLIPELEKYNPRFKQVLLRTAEALSGDYETVERIVDSTWLKVVKETGEGYLAFDAAGVVDIRRGMLRNLFRRGMETLRPNLRNLDFDTLERAADFAAAHHNLSGGPAPSQVDLIEGMSLRIEGDTLYLKTPNANLPSASWPQIEGVYELTIGSELKFDDSTRLSVFEADLNTALQSAQENSDPFTAWMDAGLSGDRFIVRTRLPGDHFRPFGMGGRTIKLSDFFVNVKLPERAREGWPLLIAGEEIAWVPGFRLADPFRITENTRQAIKLALQKK